MTHKEELALLTERKLHREQLSHLVETIDLLLQYIKALQAREAELMLKIPS